MLSALPNPYKYGEGNQTAIQLKVVEKTPKLEVQLEIQVRLIGNERPTKVLTQKSEHKVCLAKLIMYQRESPSSLCSRV